MPFRIALSGLDAASTDLKVTGNNIANASTTGFKESRTEFVSLFSSALTDVGSNTSGNGVRVSRVAQQFSQGNIDFTENNLDMAINGDGFFILEDDAGSINYTRNGAFSINREGYLVDQAGKYIQVYPPAATGVTSNFLTGVLQGIQLPTTAGAPSETTEVNISLNMDAAESQPAVVFDPTNPASYNYSTSTTVYDSLGASHTGTMYYVKTAIPGQWQTYLYVTDASGTAQNVTVGGAAFQTLTFDGAGQMTAPPLNQIAYDPLAVGGGANNLTMTYDYTGTTQYGADFGVNDLTQDGYASGRLSGMDIDKTGVIFARFTNGQSLVLGKVAIARFNNPQGLRQSGDSNWAETYESGDHQYGEAGSGSFGLIQSGALESSNVDIASQLVNLITAQRNFQANSQVISTADTVTQTIINIR